MSESKSQFPQNVFLWKHSEYLFGVILFVFTLTIGLLSKTEYSLVFSIFIALLSFIITSGIKMLYNMGTITKQAVDELRSSETQLICYSMALHEIIKNNQETEKKIKDIIIRRSPL